MSTYAPTHRAVCTDDDTVILLHHHTEPVACAVCGGDDAHLLVLADGGPGSVCTGCTADLDWVLTPL